MLSRVNQLPVREWSASDQEELWSLGLLGCVDGDGPECSTQNGPPAPTLEQASDQANNSFKALYLSDSVHERALRVNKSGEVGCTVGVMLSR